MTERLRYIYVQCWKYSVFSARPIYDDHVFFVARQFSNMAVSGLHRQFCYFEVLKLKICSQQYFTQIVKGAQFIYFRQIVVSKVVQFDFITILILEQLGFQRRKNFMSVFLQQGV